MEREHHQNKSKRNVIENPKIDYYKHNNNRKLVGASFSRKTYLMLKILSGIPNMFI